MASQIIPDPTPKASQRPAAAAQPTPVRPSAPAPKAPPKPVPATAQQPEQDQDEDQPSRPLGRGFLTQVPAWAVSMLVHIIALLVMALIAGDAAQTEKPVSIMSSASEEEEELVDIEEPEDTPEETPEEVTEPVTDVAVTTDVVVPQVDVSPIPDNSEAAPANFDLVEIGDQSAMVTEIGPVRGVGGAGVGGGFGGRKSSGTLAKKGGGGKDTEDAVDRALKWIAAHQMPDGGWHFSLQKCPSCAGQCSHSGTMADRCGATSMALLPFLGRGYTHREGPYKKQVEAGIGFLVKMALDGQGKAYGTGGGNLYSQGLAGIALSECYAMTQDGRLAAPTQYVLDFIMAAQDPVGGGWRYTPKQPGDTSAVGWQIMALKSGNMAYLSVNPLTIKKAVEFLDSVQGDEYGGTYGYTGPGKGAGTSAVGLLCRMYLGWKKDHQGIQEGAAIIAKRGPTNDLYYNYYATQIMHHMEGDMWIAWNSKMKDLLLKNQSTKGHEAGSWCEGVDGGHGAHVAGRLYCTALSTMILEVYYRHLPIYQNQSVEEEFKE